MDGGEGSRRSAPDVEGGDARMTAEREELRFLLPPSALKAFAAGMARQLSHHRFTGDGANHLPRPHHFVTTVYFDTPSRHQFQAACSSAPRQTKLRAKEYYDVHPSLAELATNPRQLVKYQPVLWLELKFKEGTKTGKRRIGIPKRDVPAFFARGHVTADMIELQRPIYGVDGEAVLREVASYCALHDEPFRADCLVNYRRLPWQDEAGRLRVTLDVGLEFFAPPADLWQRDHALVRETLGPARGRQTDGVLEVKTRGATPTWLTDLLAQLGARRASFSKFEEASRAVHG